MMKQKKKKSMISFNDYFIILAVIILIGGLTTSMIKLPYLAINSSETYSEVTDRYHIKNAQPRTLNSYCIYISGEETDTDDQIVQRSLESARLNYDVVTRFSEITRDALTKTELIIIDGNDLDSMGSISTLIPRLDAKTKVIFTSMPSNSYENIAEFITYSGIKRYDALTQHEGLTVVSGFLVGGLLELSDLTYYANHVELRSTTKVYAYSEVDESAVIWRNIYNDIEFFTVNGDFFDSGIGLGIMSALYSQTFTDYIYPVVNAMVLTYTRFPYYTTENEADLIDIYNRDAMQLQNDILIPDIVGINKSRYLVPNGFASYGIQSGEEPELSAEDKQQIKDGLNDLYELGGDVGMTFSGVLAKDQESYSVLCNKPDLKELSLSEQEVADIKSLFNDSAFSVIEGAYGPWSMEVKGFDFISDHTVFIPFTLNGAELSDYNKLNIYALATTYGAIIHNIDFERIIYPETVQDQWHYTSKDYAYAVDAYRETFGDFQKLNTDEATNAVKKYANVNAEIIQTDNLITLKFEEYLGKCYYFLRTTKEIENITGGKAKEMEQDVYIITTNSDEVNIYLN